MAFNTTLATIPAKVPYLTAPPELVTRWRERLGARRALRVGLCWAGSSTAGDIRSRSVSVFAPLADVAGVEFHNLQVGPEGKEPPPPGLRLIDHTELLDDFDQTAALVQNLQVEGQLHDAVQELQVVTELLKTAEQEKAVRAQEGIDVAPEVGGDHLRHPRRQHHLEPAVHDVPAHDVGGVGP